MPAFQQGDKVLWHHELATVHAPGSVIRTDVSDFPDKIGKDDISGSGHVGVVVGPGDEGTHWRVAFAKSERVLTEDELVKVAS